MTKRRIKFNFLDVLFILATLALVVGIIWREELIERVETKNIENTVTVCCDMNAYVTEGVDTVYGVKFEEGKTPVYMNGVEVGYVLHTKEVASAESSSDESAPQAPQVSEETTLYLKAVSRNSGYYMGGETKLLIGNEYLLHTKTSEFTVRILTVEEAEK